MHYNWLKETASKFKAVILVFGNHDYWGECLNTYPAKFADKAKDISNLHVLQNKSVIIDEIKFIGATLWTDFGKGDPVAIALARGAMNDYKKIRFLKHNEYCRVSSHNILGEFIKSKNFIESELKLNDVSKKIVITHHAPTALSVDDRFIGDSNNVYYYSDLSDLILDYSPEAWIHGHMHAKKRYMIGNTLVCNNPRGYASPGYVEKTGFYPEEYINV